MSAKDLTLTLEAHTEKRDQIARSRYLISLRLSVDLLFRFSWRMTTIAYYETTRLGFTCFGNGCFGHVFLYLPDQEEGL